jgi:dTDP-4-amino-4,6-dideoxygalactose transaminase
VFNTFEGGAIISPDARTKQHIDHLKNFGFVNETTVVATGINGKMSELNAALGLLQLKHVDAAIDRRGQIDALYRKALSGVPGVRVLDATDSLHRNYAYFPIFVEPEFPLSRDALYQSLQDVGIHGRRYFYPLISDFPMYRGMRSSDAMQLPVAREAAQRVICLPLYPALSDEQVLHVAQHIRWVSERSAPHSSPVPCASATQPSLELQAQSEWSDAQLELLAA